MPLVGAQMRFAVVVEEWPHIVVLVVPILTMLKVVGMARYVMGLRPFLMF